MSLILFEKCEDGEPRTKRIALLEEKKSQASENGKRNFYSSALGLSLSQFVCSNMRRDDLKVIAKKASHATHVIDRFHISQKINQAIDVVRASATK